MKWSPLLISAFSLIGLATLRADSPHLTSVTQPLYFSGNVAGDEIQPMSVPKIFAATEAEFLMMLYMSPTIIEGAENDMNLISAYGIKVSLDEQVEGKIRKIVVDITDAKQPENYPFSVQVAGQAAVDAIRKDMDDDVQIVLIKGGEFLGIESR